MRALALEHLKMSTRSERATLRGQVNLTFLLNLRWGAVAGQLLAIFVASHWLNLRLPTPALCLVLALMAAINLGLIAWRARTPVVSDAVLVGVMALDVLLLTCQLYLTGGPDNPFHILYIIHIALAAVMLPGPWGWGLVGLTCTAFVTLWWSHVPFHDGTQALDQLPVPIDQWGRGVAFLLASCFVVHFVHRCTAALAATEAALAAARDLTARNEKLTSLATLSAGAAHELATPLATIAVVAKELERSLGAESASAREDACLIRREVARCRLVLQNMAADAGEHAGEALVAVTPAGLLDDALAAVPGHARVRLAVEASAQPVTLVLPRRSVAQALRAAIKNAVEATPEPGIVRVRSWATATEVHFEVRDAGSGMSAEVLAHIGEPFYTTKTPGRGMGLGLFLTRTVLEGLGGRLAIQSTLGQGSLVRMQLPRATLHPGEHNGTQHPDHALDPDRGRRRNIA